MIETTLTCRKQVHVLLHGNRSLLVILLLDRRLLVSDSCGVHREDGWNWGLLVGRKWEIVLTTRGLLHLK